MQIDKMATCWKIARIIKKEVMGKPFIEGLEILIFLF
jgi:hypothetical protein